MIHYSFVKITIIWFLLFMVSAAQSKEVITITYSNQLLRDISNEYFNNPDYWEIILEYNKLESSSDLREGMSLKIPTGIVNSTLERINIANNLIAEANKNGAKVLTPKSINKAEFDYNTALLLKLQGYWKESYDKLGNLITQVNQIIIEVKNLRKSSADATISYRNGNVEKRKPTQRLWSDAELFSKLYEADRARTLSNSTAEITFLDLSRIRLNENSDAVIQHSRIDLLKNKTETKVKLIRGDAFAYLLKSPKKKFDIDIPGLNANIKSKSFWVEKGEADTKIANYEGEIELVSKNKAVVVKENQGSIIPDGGEPSNPKDLLFSPELLTPENKSKIFVDNVTLRWSSVSDAKNYWLQLSTDADFRNIIYSNKKIIENNYSIKNIKPSIYYWRVCSIDKSNLPGEFSNKNYFMVSKDISKPFLVLLKPQNFEVVRVSSFIMKGESEKGVSVFVNGEKVSTDINGNFEKEVSLVDGKNNFIVSAIDESKNKTQIAVSCYYESSAKIENKIINNNFTFNDSTFISDNNELVIKGITRPLSRISFNYNSLVNSTFADTNGYYIIQLKNISNNSRILQTIVSPADYSLKSNFGFIIKKMKPKIILESTVPRITNKREMDLIGKVENCDSMFINSQFINLDDNIFSKTIELEEGENEFQFLLLGMMDSYSEKNIFVRLDTEPPALINYDLINDFKNKNEFLLKIKASDISGLPKIAKAKLEIDEIQKEIVLLLNSNGEYSKRIYRNNSNSKPRVLSILLEDYLGNSKKYQIGNK